MMHAAPAVGVLVKHSCATGLSSQQLMEKGRKEMKAQDDSLIRAQRIVESTIEVVSFLVELTTSFSGCTGLGPTDLMGVPALRSGVCLRICQHLRAER